MIMSRDDPNQVLKTTIEISFNIFFSLLMLNLKVQMTREPIVKH